MDFKDKELLSRLKTWMVGKIASPWKADIFLTNFCSSSCIYCKNSLTDFKTRPKSELSADNWKRIINQCLEEGIKYFRFVGGGEPLTRKKLLFELIEKIKLFDKNIYIELHTNGTLITKKDIKPIMDNLDLLVVSFDAPVKKINNILRGSQDSYSCVLDLLKNLKKSKTALKIENPEIRINSTICQLNYKHIIQMIELCSDLNVHTLALYPIIVYKETINKLKDIRLTNLDKIRLKETIPQLRKLAKSKNLDLDLNSLIDCSFELNENKPVKLKKQIPDFCNTLCYEPWYVILIDSCGNVGPCCVMGKGKETENLLKKSLKEIWLGAYFSGLRDKIIKREKTEQCKACIFMDSDFVIRLREQLMKN